MESDHRRRVLASRRGIRQYLLRRRQDDQGGTTTDLSSLLYSYRSMVPDAKYWSMVPPGLRKKVYEYYSQDTLYYKAHMIPIEEQLAYCRRVVPSWNDGRLPDSVILTHKPLAGGTQSYVALIKLKGPGSEGIEPQSVVYRYIPVRDGVGEDSGKSQPVNNKFVKKAADTGVTPFIYGSTGEHRVTEFAKGQELFGGSNAFDWLSWHRSGCNLCWNVCACLDKRVKVDFPPDNSPEDATLMHSVGLSLGAIHGLDTSWLEDVIGKTELERRMAEPALWPRFVDFCVEKDVREWSPRLVRHSCGTIRITLAIILFCVSAASLRLQWPYAWLWLVSASILMLLGIREAWVYTKLPARFRELTKRVAASPSLPRDGLFAKAVWTHTDTHGGNFIVQPVPNGRPNVRIIDWDGATTGHPGMDLSFFLGCAHMPSSDARRAFARGYLTSQTGSWKLEDGIPQREPTDDEVEQLLWDMERCMSLGLVKWIASFMAWPLLIPHAARIIDLCESCLDYLESDLGPEQRKVIVEQGLVRMMDRTFSFGCISQIPCCCFR